MSVNDFLEEREAQRYRSARGTGFRSHDVEEQSALDARFFLRSHAEYELVAPLPQMGSRRGKSAFLVRHRPSGEDRIMTICPSHINYDTHGKILCDLLKALDVRSRSHNGRREGGGAREGGYLLGCREFLVFIAAAARAHSPVCPSPPLL